jgi:hypothetical protein
MADVKPLQIARQPPERAPGVTPAGPTTVSWPEVAERLREFAAARARSAAERCDLCGAAIEAEHGHLVNLPTRSLLCVCRPCYLLFTPDGAGGARFRAVPQRYRLLPEFAAAAEQWDALEIPIGLAFFFTNSATGRTTAFYPSPAGAAESELRLETWNEIVRLVPALADLAADVEAVLVRSPHAGPGADAPPPRPGSGTAVEALIVPIDACYELVGRIRRAWRGLSGGDEVWLEVDRFFARAIERARGTDRQVASR